MNNIENDTQAPSDQLTAERPWPVTIKLKHPVQYGSQTIDELVFRRGRFSDLKGMNVDGVPPVDQLITIASRMCGQFPKVIESLDLDDVGPVLDLALSFFARCLRTGPPA